ncbi:MAG: hypothetical protein ACK5OW_00545 [bacterium]|jgi:hypothetical protein
MINWFKNNKKSLIRGAFLVPIILVMFISISHVVSWYDLANPFKWAIYLSVAIEIAAMSSIAAASVRIKGGVWLVFILVTLIQFMGNIFFCFNDIDVNSKEFKSWVELTGPIFESIGSDIKDIVAQKRWLALLEGGLLPIISLTSLHFFIRYGGEDDTKIERINQATDQATDQVVEEVKEPETVIQEIVEEISTPESPTTITTNAIIDRPKKRNWWGKIS